MEQTTGSTIVIDADLLLELYNRSKTANAEEKKYLLAMIDVLSSRLGETLD